MKRTPRPSGSSGARRAAAAARPVPVGPPPASLSAPAVLPWIVAGVALLVPGVMLILARAAGGPFAFPVDDAWIHLTYARNLADHGAWTYFPGDPSTTGSTAPLFTMIEALLFRATRNEFAIGLGLGLAGYALFLAAFVLWAKNRIGHAGWAALAVALVALDGRFGMLAASGMETSLFLAGLALAFLAWTSGGALLAGLALGVTVWIRPEALLLAAVFAIDAAIARRMPRHGRAGLALFVLLVAGYVVFNSVTGGAAFPNTLAAKSAFYSGRGLGVFLHDDVAATFAAAWAALLPIALVYGVVRLSRTFAQRPERAPSLAEVGWTVALPLAYACVLPFSHRFNRYLVPALPALAIAGAHGLRRTIEWLKPRGARSRLIGPAVAAVLIGAQASWFAYSWTEYGAIARYTAERQVQAGHCLAAHTPKDAIVATHDVGAIGFYSGRRIVDMAGLVSPEVVPHLNRPDWLAWLDAYLDRRHVTHLAVLEEWQPVDNQPPIFEASPEPEVLHVYDWRPGRTHLLTTELTGRLAAARAALEENVLPLARTAVEDVLRRDPQAASAWTLMGIVRGRAGALADADSAFHRALALDPESEVAKNAIARIEAPGRFDTTAVIPGP